MLNPNLTRFENSADPDQQASEKPAEQDKNSKYDQEIPQSETADKPMVPRGRKPHSSHVTPGIQSKVTSSLFPIKTIAKLVLDTSNTHQNIV